MRHLLERSVESVPRCTRFCTDALILCMPIVRSPISTRDMVQIDEGKLSIRSLKKRGRHHIREVPVSEILITTLNTQVKRQNQPKLIWAMTDEPVSRIKAYRWIKSVFHKCKLEGPHACPKGLRHGFGVHAICSGVQLHMVQRWMGRVD